MLEALLQCDKAIKAVSKELGSFDGRTEQDR
jgi:hypothetical protein